MAKKIRATFAFKATILVAAIGVVLWVVGLIGLSMTGTVGTAPNANQILFACSGMFASIFVAFAGIIHAATVTRESPNMH